MTERKVISAFFDTEREKGNLAMLPPEPISLGNKPENVYLIQDLVSNFCHLVNPKISNLISFYGKRDAQIPDMKYVLQPIPAFGCREDIVYELWDGSWQDGDYGFALLADRGEYENPVFLAQSTFCFYPRKTSAFNKIRDIELPNYSLVIVQIQGPLKTYPTRELSNQILSTFRWEQFLVDCTLEWAKINGVQNSYIIPGHLNRWIYEENDMANREKQERFCIRYNGTAKKCGFVKGTNGLFVLT